MGEERVLVEATEQFRSVHEPQILILEGRQPHPAAVQAKTASFAWAVRKAWPPEELVCPVLGNSSLPVPLTPARSLPFGALTSPSFRWRSGWRRGPPLGRTLVPSRY